MRAKNRSPDQIPTPPNMLRARSAGTPRRSWSTMKVRKDGLTANLASPLGGRMRDRVPALPLCRQRSAARMPLGDQGALEEIEPFLHGVELLAQLPDRRVGRGDRGRAGFQPPGECARETHDDHADRGDSDDGRDPEDREQYLLHPSTLA